MNILFCPNCHKIIEPPAFLKSDKVNILGTIILKCGNCKTGQVKIKLNKPEQKGGAESQSVDKNIPGTPPEIEPAAVPKCILCGGKGKDPMIIEGIEQRTCSLCKGTGKNIVVEK